jgi:hypothetical protein
MDPRPEGVSNAGCIRGSRENLAVERSLLVPGKPKLRCPTPHVAFLAARERLWWCLNFYFWCPIYQLNLSSEITSMIRILLLLDLRFGLLRSLIRETERILRRTSRVSAILLRDELAEKRWPVTAKVVHRVYFSAIRRENASENNLVVHHRLTESG